jgi:hypothetical protein
MGILSEWGLRERAAEEGWPVSGKQFRDYLRVGVLPPPSEGGWSEDMVERLVAVRKLGEEVRSLHRRTIRLWRSDLGIAPGKLRAAMIRVVPTIAAPKRNMDKLNRAIDALSGPSGWAPMPETLPGVDIPERGRWHLLLSAFRDDEFGQIAGARLYYAGLLKDPAFPEAHDILADVPIEEVVILLTVQAFAQTAVGQAKLSEPPTR